MLLEQERGPYENLQVGIKPYQPKKAKPEPRRTPSPAPVDPYADVKPKVQSFRPGTEAGRARATSALEVRKQPSPAPGQVTLRHDSASLLEAIEQHATKTEEKKKKAGEEHPWQTKPSIFTNTRFSEGRRTGPVGRSSNLSASRGSKDDLFARLSAKGPSHTQTLAAREARRE